MQTAIQLAVPHISAYALTVEENTALHHFIEHKKCAPVEEEKSARQFIQLMDTLPKADFIQYEISNFGKEGFFSKHGKLVAEFVNSGSNDKKLIKKIETLRNTFIKNIGKINKDLDTLQKLEKKLRAAVAKEDAEAAKAAAANAEAESPDDAEENEGEQSDGEE